MFIAKRKNGYYYLFITDETTGKRKNISCKTKRKPAALKFLSKFVTTSQNPLQKNTVIYLSDLQKEIMKYVNDNLRAGTCKIYKSTFKNLLRIINDKPIKLITSNEIEKFKSVRLSEVSQTTVNIDLNTIKSILNLAIRFNWIEKNPAKDIKKISIPQRERLSFNDFEIKLILSNSNLFLKNIVSFALYTGMRLNEICNVQLKDIDFNDRLINIYNKENFKTKSGKHRQIPISNSLLILLNVLLEQKPNDNVLTLFNPEHYLFSRNGFKLSCNYVSKQFKTILRKCNLDERFHFHCLRHTAITNLIKSGVNINYVRQIAGHSEIQTTMNYIHIVTNDLREAVNTINI